ncbi:hypothetical protein QFC22_006013 [Naganishia vaughanmartiniae]|uniref:Uncharacterized protein n=1 Tax=Naganishia vaughanmartiniae TaxID=1424756 RepID=A0ACC2WPT9_9TREE|nr:hypothetical protein QFC22_006013 [Naganishia vaughanmartiniae]
MLAELRTSSLTPKQYYELYMSVFDTLRHLSNYLYDAHVAGKHHLADLYELVQYAGNIVPRLYLMITVGSVYMSIPEAPVKEIMKDMMEMARGVQHPTRGLFLRHYLSGLTRDYLPVGDSDGPGGNLQDSIAFVLSNFIEMNKLWVRLQHQGPSREREKRELERKELRILVGTNLVRLSQLEGVDLDMYMRGILPRVLEQIVGCKDVIAQEYLMEVVIQVFTDDFHLHTLGPFLSATAALHPRVNIKQIVIALIDRLAAYAAREADNEDPEERKRGEEEAARRLAERVKGARIAGKGHQALPYHAAEELSAGTQVLPAIEGNAWGGDGPSSTESSHDEHSTDKADSSLETRGEPNPALNDTTVAPNGDVDSALTSSLDKGKGKEGNTVKKFRGIPEDVKLFEVFWQQIVQLIRASHARPDLSIQDISALLVSLINLSLSCYPDRLEYVDQILAFASGKVREFSSRQVIPTIIGSRSNADTLHNASSPELHTPATTANFLSLLLSPITSYISVLTLLAIPSYIPLLSIQPFTTRASIGQAVVASVLKNGTIMETAEDVSGVLGLCAVLVKDQKEAGPIPQQSGANFAQLPQGQMGRAQKLNTHSQVNSIGQDLAEEQGWLARMVHLFRSDDLATQFELLQVARKIFAEGGQRIRYTFPPLIASGIKLARRYKVKEAEVDDWESKISSVFKFVHQVISVLYNKVEASDLCLHLFLLAAQVADECGLEELGYEFFVQAFVIYEESISESRAQLQAITAIITALQTSRVFGTDNYDTLITKAALHGSKLLKKPHQATAVFYASHMWWQGEVPGREKDDRPLFRDGKRVLECLQKSLRIASSCIDEVQSVQLYVAALDQYLYYFEQLVEAVTPKYINSLVELITSNIDLIHGTDTHPASSAPPGLLEGVHSPDMIVQHFRNTLLYIQERKNTPNDDVDEPRPDWEAVDIAGASAKLGLV